MIFTNQKNNCKEVKMKPQKQKLSKKKLRVLLLSLVAVVVVINLATAYYFFGYDMVITGSAMSGGEPLTITLDLSDTFLIDTTTEPIVYTDDLDLLNIGGDVPMITALTITKTDLTGGSCPNYETDCSVTFTKGMQELQDATPFTMTAGSNTFGLEISCPHRSCEHEIEIDLSLNEVI